MMIYLIYAGIVIAGVWGLRAFMQERLIARALGAVGSNVALVIPRTETDGSLELKFLIGEFQLIDTNFYLRLQTQEAFIVPNPLLVKLRNNPAPELFEGAPYVLRLSDEEAKQLMVLSEASQECGELIN